jgi:Kef-type K+ transport system membrane component KefB
MHDDKADARPRALLMNGNATPISTPTRAPHAWRVGLAYAAMIAAAATSLWVVRDRGAALKSTAAASMTTAAPASTANGDVLMHVLLALAAIILTGRWLGKACIYIGQPRVVGEMLAGIVLGPSVLGRLWPEATEYLLPPSAAPALWIIAQIGIVLYMFLIGLELNAGMLRSHARATVVIAHASIVVPFVLGVILALWLYQSLAPKGVPFMSFSLFIGVAMSITAFPVLARILSDRGIASSELGVLALGCAAIGDVTAWCLLALVVGVVQAAAVSAVQTAALALGFVAVMLLVVRPLAVHYLHLGGRRHPSQRMAVWVLVSLLLSALAAEWVGIHAIFGAFLLGAVIPHDSIVARDFQQKLEDIVKIQLLPAYFAYTGMRTEIGLVSGWTAWLTCGVITLAATVGKFGGTTASARWSGLNWPTSTSLGVLMNTRGLMELIVLTIGLELGVISRELFAMMVIMALVTTMATTPALHFLTSARPQPGADERAA